MENGDPAHSPELIGEDNQPLTANLQHLFFTQLSACQMEIAVGPNRSMKWGVPDGSRDESSGDLLHDDLLIYTPQHTPHPHASK